jgi:hypothetical protein
MPTMSLGGVVMTKTLVGLAPVAVATAVLGAVIWYLFEQDLVIASWLFAIFLAGHGLVHIMFAVPRPAGAAATANGVDYPFDASHSWVVTRAGADTKAVRSLVLALVAVTIGGYLLAAMATVGFILPSSAWAALVAVSTLASSALLLLELSPALVIGIAIDAALLWLVFITGWSPATALGL